MTKFTPEEMEIINDLPQGMIKELGYGSLRFLIDEIDQLCEIDFERFIGTLYDFRGVPYAAMTDDEGGEVSNRTSNKKSRNRLRQVLI